MSDIRSILIQKNATYQVLDNLESFLSLVCGFDELFSSTGWKETRPKPISHYRHLDNMTGVTLTHEEINRVKQQITRNIFKGVNPLVDVVTIAEYADMDESDKQSVQKSKQSLFMGTQIGKEYAETIYALNDAYRLVSVKMRKQAIWSHYGIWELFMALSETRYNYFQSNVSLETFARAMKLLLDQLKDPTRMLSYFAASVTSSQRVRLLDIGVEASEAQLKKIERYLEVVELFSPLAVHQEIKEYRAFNKHEELIQYLGDLLADKKAEENLNDSE